jgi:hypothetical protein
MSASTILFPLLIIGGIFLMMRMHGGHGGHGGGGGGHGGGGGCGSHGSSDKDPAQPTSEPKPVAASEVGKPQPPRGHSGH